MTLGYNTKGTEDYFRSMLLKAIADRTTPQFRYVEIGIAEGTTLRSVAELLRHEMQRAEYQVCGIDLLDGPFFNAMQFMRSTSSFDIQIEYEGSCRREPYVMDTWGRDIRILLLKGDSKRAMVSPGCINFALIDGCHGAPCVEKDFLAIEAGMAIGGIVAFHDAGSEDQGIHFQNHCQMPINVIRALNALGLGPNAIATQFNPETGVSSDGCNRPGWKFIGSVDGDKSPGDLAQNGHGFKFFQRVATPRKEETPNANNTSPI